jgi:hypothetical protein
MSAIKITINNVETEVIDDLDFDDEEVSIETSTPITIVSEIISEVKMVTETIIDEPKIIIDNDVKVLDITYYADKRSDNIDTEHSPEFLAKLNANIEAVNKKHYLAVQKLNYTPKYDYDDPEEICEDDGLTYEEYKSYQEKEFKNLEKFELPIIKKLNSKINFDNLKDAEYYCGSLDRYFIIQNQVTRKYQIFYNAEDFKKYMNNLREEDRVFVERIPGDYHQKIRFDLDFPNATDKNGNKIRFVDDSLKMSNGFKEDCFDNLIKAIIITYKKQYGKDLDPENILPYCGRIKKYNRHIVITNVCVSDHSQAKEFYKKVIANMDQKYVSYEIYGISASGKEFKDLKWILDPAVYNRNGTLRMAGNTKKGENNFKELMAWDFNDKPVQQEYEFLDSLISYTKSCVLLKDIIIPKFVKIHRIQDNVKFEGTIGALDIILRLCDLGQIICDYKKWRSLIGFMYGQYGNTPEAIDYIFGLSQEFYTNANEKQHNAIFNYFESKWNTPNFFQPNIGLIYSWLKDHNLLAFNELMKINSGSRIKKSKFFNRDTLLEIQEYNKPPKKPIHDPEIKTCLSKFLPYISGVQDPKLVDEWIISSSAFIFNGGKGYFITKNFNETGQLQYDFIPNIKFPAKTCITLANPEFNPDKKATKLTNPETISYPIFEYVSMKLARTFTYTYTTFKPYYLEKPEFDDDGIFNLFAGFRANIKPTLKIDMSKLTLILDHIKHIWCMDDNNSYNYIIKWFASIFQKPDQKTKVAIILKSEKQQAGKQIIINFIGEYIIGKQYFGTVLNAKHVVGDFNKVIQNKVLTVMDEVSWGGDIKVNNTLKSLITQPTQQIEMKGFDAFEVNDYNNYIFCSNLNWPLAVESGDARIYARKVSGDVAKNLSYMKKLSANFNEETAEHLYNWFLRIDISEFKTQDIPMTEFKRELMFESASSFEKFLFDSRDGYVQNLKDGDVKQSEHFYNIFKNWCSTSRIKNSDTARQFMHKVGKIGLKEKRVQKVRHLIWDMKIIKKYLDQICPDNSEKLEEINIPDDDDTHSLGSSMSDELS